MILYQNKVNNNNDWTHNTAGNNLYCIHMQYSEWLYNVSYDDDV